MQIDGKVYNVSNIEKTQLRLINAWGEYMYPISVTYGANDHEVYLHFDNINTFGANKLECLQTIAMGRRWGFLIDISYNLLKGLDMEVVDITVSGDSGSFMARVLKKGTCQYNFSKWGKYCTCI